MRKNPFFTRELLMGINPAMETKLQKKTLEKKKSFFADYRT